MAHIERRSRLMSLDLDRHYECFICMDRLADPQKCQKCAKSVCGSHVPSLRNRCPNCRVQPFRPVSDDTMNIVLKCLKREEWQALNMKNRYNCKIEDCVFSGNYVAMIRHRKRAHQAKTIEEVMEGVYSHEKNRIALNKIANKLRAYRVTIQTLSAVQNLQVPDDPEERKKHPTHVYARQMAVHINSCESSECRKMWNTKWGSYIGREGLDVPGQFFFSICESGKKLNSDLGWNYSDPTH